VEHSFCEESYAFQLVQGQRLGKGYCDLVIILNQDVVE
jgi:hypothetical protein